jgi:hypothetical protein
MKSSFVIGIDHVSALVYSLNPVVVAIAFKATDLTFSAEELG